MNWVPGARILCVDEDLYSSEWVKQSLKAASVSAAVTTAASGRDAFMMLNRGVFDLCILEYPLPDMTGVQLCSLLRQTGSGIPVMHPIALLAQQLDN